MNYSLIQEKSESRCQLGGHYDERIIIDPKVQDYPSLIEEVSDNIAVRILDSSRDGIQLSEQYRELVIIDPGVEVFHLAKQMTDVHS